MVPFFCFNLIYDIGFSLTLLYCVPSMVLCDLQFYHSSLCKTSYQLQIKTGAVTCHFSPFSPRIFRLSIGAISFHPLRELLIKPNVLTTENMEPSK